MPIEDVAMSDTSKELTIRSTPLIVCWNHTNFKVEVGFCCWCEIERLREALRKITTYGTDHVSMKYEARRALGEVEGE